MIGLISFLGMPAKEKQIPSILVQSNLFSAMTVNYNRENTIVQD